ncbi:HAD family hydrolase [Paenibacillus dendritiformis]|uniref:HAD family hydrolase n=1 Tax=Paenibacillus dendritiformis TaxID=130049 RepID=UPI00387E0958
MAVRKNVLIYPWGNSEALEVYRALHKSVHVKIITDENHSVEKIDIDSRTESENIHCLNRWKSYLKDNEIDYIYCADDYSKLFFNANENIFGKVLINSEPTVLFTDRSDYSANVTLDCFSTEEKKIIFKGAFRNDNGKIIPVPISDEMEQILKIMVDKYGYIGYWNIQLSSKNELLAINSNWSKGISLWVGLGVNLPLLSLYQKMGNPIYINSQKFPIGGVSSFKYKINVELAYKQIYIDLDDTLVISNKVNLQAITYIYQCINNGIKVHLISKHRGDIYNYLQQYKLINLFDSIIWLKEDEEKYKYIDPEDSIFIDDAFKERVEVQRKLAIPTFEVCAIEYLIHG